MAFRHNEINIELHAIGDYGCPEMQKEIIHDIKKVCREECLSHEAVIDDMSFKFALPGLKATIPDPHRKGQRIAYPIGVVTIYRRWLSLLLRVNEDGYPRHVPCLLERIRELHLYLLIKAELCHYKT